MKQDNKVKNMREKFEPKFGEAETKEPDPLTNEAEEEKESQRELFYKRVKEGLRETFRSFPSGQERIKAVITEIPMLTDDEKERLMPCGEISDEQEFVEDVFKVIERFADWRIADEKGFRKEKVERMTGFKMVGDLLSYGMEQDLVHIHLTPISSADKIGAKKFEKELSELAEIIYSDPRVEKIRTTSWIVAEHPDLLEYFGFTVGGPISEKEKEKYFPNEEKPVWDACISREDFLKRYLK